jgi:hypothetical protein
MREEPKEWRTDYTAIKEAEITVKSGCKHMKDRSRVRAILVTSLLCLGSRNLVTLMGIRESS